MTDYRGRRGTSWERLREQVRHRRELCCRCGLAIDYSLPFRNALTGEVDGRSFSVDHYPHPLSTHPHLAQDLSNLHAAHLRCNQQAQAKGRGIERTGADHPAPWNRHNDPQGILGVPSEEW